MNTREPSENLPEDLRTISARLDALAGQERAAMPSGLVDRLVRESGAALGQPGPVVIGRVGNWRAASLAAAVAVAGAAVVALVMNRSASPATDTAAPLAVAPVQGSVVTSELTGAEHMVNTAVSTLASMDEAFGDDADELLAEADRLAASFSTLDEPANSSQGSM
jgi:hypothetical protein